MIDQHDEDVLRHVDALLDIEPSPESTQRVLQKVERQVLEGGKHGTIPLAKDPASSSRSRAALLIMSGGLAAAAMLIVGVVWYSVWGSPDAKLELAQAVSEQPTPPRNDNSAADNTNRRFRADRFDMFSQVHANQDWQETSAIGVLGGMLYIADDEKLYEVSPMDGSFRVIGDAVWPNTAAIGGLGERLYIVQNDQLYEVNAKSGTRRGLSAPGEWPQTESMATLGGKLFIVSSGLLHRVSPEDGSYEVLRKREAASND